ncbi:hypothetical protein AURDEDRAFT_189116 [Auricularia subglabra TFB-10046 SS5]|uniref:F-box domain-containing protein n=1 Tax=Auricularia subglabra (strain TFB-10046 / SS5) TaxID=717982 RepID=J0L8Y9_AURST|nr:hypothetical protein AURDEDRAFT_189116 [Auricularia subglabra TFB-10046 SS5]
MDFSRYKPAYFVPMGWLGTLHRFMPNFAVRNTFHGCDTLVTSRERSIHDLPDELLGIVIGDCTAQELTSPRAVSRRWRRVVDGLSQLWATLDLRADPIVVAALPSLLARSRETALHLSLTVPRTSEIYLPAICELLACHAHRMRHLAIHGDEVCHYGSLAGVLSAASPKLLKLDLSPRSLSIFGRLETADRDIGLDATVRSLSDLLSTASPNLLHIDMTYRGLSVFQRLDIANWNIATDGQFGDLFSNDASQLRSVDWGSLMIPKLPQLALRGVTELSINVSRNHGSFVNLFSQFPSLEMLFLSGGFMALPPMSPPPYHPLKSVTFYGISEGAALEWQRLLLWEVPTLWVCQGSRPTHSTVSAALADRAWKIRSLTVDYGSRIAARFQSGTRVCNLLVTDNVDHWNYFWTCGDLMYNRACVSNIVELTLSLALAPTNQEHSMMLVPQLQLRALACLTILCGTPTLGARALPYNVTLFHPSILPRCTMRAPALRTIRLSSRLNGSSKRPTILPSPSTGAHSSNGAAGTRTTIRPSSVADFIDRIQIGPELPELRIDEPYVSLVQATAELERLMLVVSGIRNTLRAVDDPFSVSPP